MGRLAVPSALAIGSVVPDLWYFVPFVSRLDSHSLAALAWFCVPAGLVVYFLFHLVLKQPLVALLSAKLGHFACRGLPAAPWYAVLASLLAGAATHIAWDALTHSEDHAIQGINWPQHASTALGTLVLAWWIWRKLRSAPLQPAALSTRFRLGVALMLGATAVLAGIHFADPSGSFRHVLRSAAVAAAQASAVAIFVYCAVWHFRARRITSA